jgi:hypothetical protein
MSVAQKKNPALWERMKAKAKDKMGGKHSARASTKSDCEKSQII